MKTKFLLIVTAIVESGAGIAFLIAPSLMTELMLGKGLSTPSSIMVGRVAGIALLSIGLVCWLERGKVGNGQLAGLIVGLLVYNVSIPILLVYAAVVENMSGVAFWPGIGLHSGLSIWCVRCFRSHDS